MYVKIRGGLLDNVCILNSSDIIITWKQVYNRVIAVSLKHKPYCCSVVNSVSM